MSSIDTQFAVEIAYVNSLLTSPDEMDKYLASLPDDPVVLKQEIKTQSANLDVAHAIITEVSAYVELLDGALKMVAKSKQVPTAEEFKALVKSTWLEVMKDDALQSYKAEIDIKREEARAKAEAKKAEREAAEAAREAEKAEAQAKREAEKAEKTRKAEEAAKAKQAEKTRKAAEKAEREAAKAKADAVVAQATSAKAEPKADKPKGKPKAEPKAPSGKEAKKIGSRAAAAKAGRDAKSKPQATA